MLPYGCWRRATNGTEQLCGGEKLDGKVVGFVFDAGDAALMAGSLAVHGVTEGLERDIAESCRELLCRGGGGACGLEPQVWRGQMRSRPVLEGVGNGGAGGRFRGQW
jgi:hypothetical protein